jgi:glutamate synthase domain-containing protein 3
MKVIDAKNKDLKTTNGLVKKILDGQPIAIRNARHLHGLVAGLNKGELIVRGSAGDYLGALNSGAKITVTRNAGKYAADNMTSGAIIIEEALVMEWANIVTGEPSWSKEMRVILPPR